MKKTTSYVFLPVLLLLFLTFAFIFFRFNADLLHGSFIINIMFFLTLSILISCVGFLISNFNFVVNLIHSLFNIILSIYTFTFLFVIQPYGEPRLFSTVNFYIFKIEYTDVDTAVIANHITNPTYQYLVQFVFVLGVFNLGLFLYNIIKRKVHLKK